ncbi:LrgB family protein [Thalassotalea ponticola]|uniref:LrgB family protein n=1 Tax=Thalassotalea ponticola TaxID=1523392 RepID=UPI0025B60CF4|nr:LrgB family protein [Thalassotalea ponticola]MDN3652372.1 LrgB family protein [Thalassotalea ponticola]
MISDAKLAALATLLQSSELTGLIITLLAYTLAVALFKRSGANPIVNPVIVSVIIIISVLLVTGISYEQYFVGGKLVHFLLGPAVVALAIPLYQQIHRIKSLLLPITITLMCSIFIGAFSAIYLVQWLGGSELTQLSIAPKSTTTPVAMGIADNLGGIVSLAAGLAAMTGVIGAIFGTKVFSLVGVKDDSVKGVAMGLTSHGIGTARAFQVSPTMGAFSGLAMALTACVTAILLPLILAFFNFI